MRIERGSRGGRDWPRHRVGLGGGAKIPLAAVASGPQQILYEVCGIRFRETRRPEGKKAMGNFTAEDAMKTARGYHFAAGELEAMHQQTRIGRSYWVRIVLMLSKTSIGLRLMRLVINGLNFARRFLFRPKLINVEQLMGRVSGAVVLEALALELVLKARLKQSGIDFDVPLKGMARHDHAKLYALLPDSEKQAADQRYRSIPFPAMHSTLAEALDFSAQVFTEWRYMHEDQHRSGVQASMGDMQRAFRALAEGM
jgi:hypothetical protein